MPKKFLMPLIDRFKCNFEVNTETGCWNWIGSINGVGYGFFSNSTMGRLAHRVSYQLFIGELESSRIKVCHKCDNKKCVNPFHLFSGSQSENLRDMIEKGRYVQKRERIIIDGIVHGTIYGYTVKKCGCDECLEAIRAYTRIKNKEYYVSKGTRQGKPKLTEAEAYDIKVLLKTGTYQHKFIAQIFNISATNVSNIKRGLAWGHLKLKN